MVYILLSNSNNDLGHQNVSQLNPSCTCSSSVQSS